MWRSVRVLLRAGSLLQGIYVNESNKKESLNVFSRRGVDKGPDLVASKGF